MMAAYGPRLLWVLLTACIAAVNARLSSPVCATSDGAGKRYCSCQEWQQEGRHEPYLGFIDEAAELKQALQASHHRKE